MEPLDPLREALIARIEAAFPDPGYPSNRRPCNHRCEECDELGEIFQGKRWHEILDVPMFPDLNTASSLLSDDASGYFLPALMVGCLHALAEADVTLEFLGCNLLDTKRSTLRVLSALAVGAREATFDWLGWWIDYGDFEDWDPDDRYDRFVHERAEEYRERLRVLRSLLVSA